MIAAVCFLFVVAIAVAIWHRFTRYKKHQATKAKRLAAQYGFEVDTDSKDPPGQQFDQ